MITQFGQFFLIRGGVFTIVELHKSYVVIQKWVSGKLYKVKIKDIRLHYKGAAWTTNKVQPIK
jgi:hypothetical protein